MQNQQLSPEVQTCIDHCLACHKTCLSELSGHCLEMGGAHVEPGHFRLMMDCAQICGVAADFMLRGSKHHPHVCAECADICRDCAASCEGIEGMEACAAQCRECENTCRQMAQVAA